MSLAGYFEAQRGMVRRSSSALNRLNGGQKMQSHPRGGLLVAVIQAAVKLTHWPRLTFRHFVFTAAVAR